jgi:hypothetical protein
MSLNQQENNFYLQSMGVVTWHERRSSVLCFSIKSGNKYWSLIASCGDKHVELQQQLWENIKDSLCFLVSEDGDSLADHVIVFGDSYSDKISAKEKKVTYSLAELVEKPHLKAEVWDVIKNTVTVRS